VIEHEEGIAKSDITTRPLTNSPERITGDIHGQTSRNRRTDLGAESRKMLQQMATDITDEFNKDLNPGPAQLLYEPSRPRPNEVVVKDAVATPSEHNDRFNSAATNPGN